MLLTTVLLWALNLSVTKYILTHGLGPPPYPPIPPLLPRFAFPNSLGHSYAQGTRGLGFKPNRHEGKIVGLAAYGNPEHLRDVLLDRFECSGGDIRIRAALNGWLTRALAARFATARGTLFGGDSVADDLARRGRVRGEPGGAGRDRAEDDEWSARPDSHRSLRGSGAERERCRGSGR